LNIIDIQTRCDRVPFFRFLDFTITQVDDISDDPSKPINLTVDYLRPGFAGTLTTRAMITKKGRRMASVETMAWLEDETKPVAKALFHFLLV